jgi:site-specific recombinase XerD
MASRSLLGPIPAKDSKTLTLIHHELARDPRLASQNTRRGYQADLDRFEEWRASRPMTKLLVEEYATVLQGRGQASSTINRALSAVRWWASRLGELAYEDARVPKEQREEVVTQAARVSSIENVKGERLPKGRHIPDGQVRAILNAAAEDGALAGLRDVALIAVAWATGARQSELTGIRVEDVVVDLEKEEAILTIRKGKGNKPREIAVYHGTFEALTDWLTVRGNAPGYVFCPMKKGRKLAHARRLSHEAMRIILFDRVRGSKIAKETTWHDFRRTFIGNLLDHDVDLATAQKLAGHADPKTTSNYDRRAKDVQRQAVQTLRLPYHRRTLPIGLK